MNLSYMSFTKWIVTKVDFLRDIQNIDTYNIFKEKQIF